MDVPEMGTYYFDRPARRYGVVVAGAQQEGYVTVAFSTDTTTVRVGDLDLTRWWRPGINRK
jgi:hypothetical protein